MRWLSSAICTSGEPVSPSVVAYSAMIFFLVSASVPIDMRGSFSVSLRGAPGPVHPGTGIRGRSRRCRPSGTTSGRQRGATRENSRHRKREPPTGEEIEERARNPAARLGPPSVSSGVEICEVDPLDPANEPVLHAMWDVSRGRAGRPPVRGLGAVDHGVRHLDDRARRPGRRDVGGDGRRRRGGHGRPRDAAPRQPARRETELFVHPDHRRRGIGAALLATVVDRSRAGGRTVLMTSPYSPVDRPGAGEEFLAAQGFELGIAEMSQVCDLGETEGTWPDLAAEIAPQHADYRLGGLAGRGCPNRSSRATAVSGRRSTTRHLSATSTSGPRSGRRRGSPNATRGSWRPGAASSGCSRTPPTGRAWRPPSSS